MNTTKTIMIAGAMLLVSASVPAHAQLTPGIWQALYVNCSADSDSYDLKKCQTFMHGMGCRDVVSAFYAWGGKDDLNFSPELRRWIISTCKMDSKASTT